MVSVKGEKCSKLNVFTWPQRLFCRFAAVFTVNGMWLPIVSLYKVINVVALIITLIKM